MILSELRIMDGPNMWSGISNLLVLKINSSYTPSKADKIIKWAKICLEDLNEEQLQGTPSSIVAYVLAELVKQLQPSCQNLFTDIKLLGQDSYYAIVEYAERDSGKEAAYAACGILESVLQDSACKTLDEVKANISEISRNRFLGPSTSAIVEAAVRRNIPFRRCIGGFIAFGQGAFQKKIAASISENTSDISVDIAGDKDITKKILEEALLPVPKGHVVKEYDEIEKIAGGIEYPVVIKPLNANQGKGITSNITDKKGLQAAFELAQKFSRYVIMEKHIVGNDYRFLVIGNKLTAVAHRIPACVTGDGKSTIEQLIAMVNADPLRGEGHGSALTKITLDEVSMEILRKAGLSPQSIPGKDSCVYLKDTANLSTGGTAIDVTDEVHPENIVLAERVAALIGLDICGIDIMAPDVRTPISRNGGAILEVNAAPGLRMHVAPSKGRSRNIGDPIMNLLFPGGARSRIPIVAVTGTNGKTTTSRLMAHLVSLQGYEVGFTSTDGIYLGKTCIYKGDCSGPQSASLILREPSVDFAVLECARGGIIRSGLAFDQCDIAIVTNVAADHLGLKDIYTIEDLAKVKSVVPKSVSANGYAILNASDDLVYAMRTGLKCKVGLFCIDAANAKITAHCESGGAAAVISDKGEVVILKGHERVVIDKVVNIPLSLDGKADFMIENILAATLAAYLLNFDNALITEGLRSFKPSVEQTPGRLNTFKINGVNVLLDYAHNPHGLKALGKFLNNINAPVTGIITAVGDRRDEDIVEVGKVAAAMFRNVIIRFDKNTRGRATDEIAALIVKGLRQVKPGIEYIVIADSKAALSHAIENAEKGSYIVISADDTDDTIQLVKQLEKDYNLFV